MPSKSKRFSFTNGIRKNKSIPSSTSHPPQASIVETTSIPAAAPAAATSLDTLSSHFDQLNNSTSSSTLSQTLCSMNMRNKNRNMNSSSNSHNEMSELDLIMCGVGVPHSCEMLLNNPKTILPSAQISISQQFAQLKRQPSQILNLDAFKRVSPFLAQFTSNGDLYEESMQSNANPLESLLNFESVLNSEIDKLASFDQQNFILQQQTLLQQQLLSLRQAQPNKNENDLPQNIPFESNSTLNNEISGKVSAPNSQFDMTSNRSEQVITSNTRGKTTTSTGQRQKRTNTPHPLPRNRQTIVNSKGIEGNYNQTLFNFNEGSKRLQQENQHKQQQQSQLEQQQAYLQPQKQSILVDHQKEIKPNQQQNQSTNSKIIDGLLASEVLKAKYEQQHQLQIQQTLKYQKQLQQLTQLTQSKAATAVVAAALSGFDEKRTTYQNNNSNNNQGNQQAIDQHFKIAYSNVHSQQTQESQIQKQTQSIKKTLQQQQQQLQQKQQQVADVITKNQNITSPVQRNIGQAISSRLSSDVDGLNSLQKQKIQANIQQQNPKIQFSEEVKSIFQVQKKNHISFLF